MKKAELVLNTIAMKDQLEQGVSQGELLGQIANLGIRTVEVRREFFQNVESELVALKEQAHKLGLTLFYSVNDEVVKNHRINLKLTDYIAELKQMNGQSIKFNVGNFTNFQGDLVKDLAPLLGGDYSFTVENNQVLTHSKLQNIAEFMRAVTDAKLKVSFVFDAANWYWLNEDPFKAAEVLDGVSHYLHLKNFITTDDGLVTVPLSEGEMDWRAVTSHLHEIDYVALEYPTTAAEIKETVKRLVQENMIIL